MSSKIGIIVRREYMERVGKKSFIITTLIMPIVMVILMALPTIAMFFAPQDSRKIMVIDKTGIIAPQMHDSEEITFVRAQGEIPLDVALKDDSVDGVMVIPANAIRVKSPEVKYYSDEAIGMMTETNISEQIAGIIRDEKLKNYNITNLDEILDETNTDVTLRTFRTDADSSESSSTVSYALGFIMTFLLYMILLLYGQMVMNSIIEEKNNRVLELVVSSVSPTRLMLGKIFGIGLVAVTQIAIWMILTMMMSAFLLPMLIPADLAADMASMQAGTLDTSSLDNNLDFLQAISLLSDVGYIATLFVLLILYLVGGFLLYAAMYAAVGSAVDNIQDASQLTTVVTLPIIFGIVCSVMAVSNPSGIIAEVTSYIPFTSPMVMIARVPFHVPAWQIVVSLVVLYASVFVMAWIAAKIYRIGIFMYGKKPKYKDLVAWMRYK